MTVTRRDFLSAGLVSVGSGLIVPPVLAKGVFAAGINGIHNDRVLVVLQLAGGSDGLNAVVPYADPAYLAARPTLGIRPDKVLPLHSGVGLNPALPNLTSLFDAGQVALVQGVGYDKPSYSHFESLYVWEYADPQRAQTEGWLGKALATQMDTQGHPLTACALGETSTPPELRAPGAPVSVIQSVKAYALAGGHSHQAAAPALYRRTPGIYGALFDSALSTAEAGTQLVQGSAATYTPAVPYTAPATPAAATPPAAAPGTTPAAAGPKAPAAAGANTLADALQLTAQLIITEPSVKICHVALGGWDTHQDEAQRQTALLAELDTALGAFMKDLAAHGQADRVVVMTWSEFGRRVAENGSGGTDHGAAAPVFVIGKPVAGGLYGEQPSLTATVDGGNLKYSVDFRSVYQSLIGDWLQGDARSVLGAFYPHLPVIRAA